ncbi:cobalamin-binding protein [Alteribacillus sp. HJP-4]|uniref:cobalamin-binding protein n=1 Tax=Alteribacillus sp. HJP-4 TaxID=2775394 RepID=UPI0035CD23AB
MRIASLCPSNTETAAYLGLTSQLIAVDDYSDWPGAVNQLPRLGPDLSIDVEKLKTLKPDLVLASLSVPGMEKNIEKLKKENIPYIVSGPDTIKDIRNDFFLFGEAADAEERAKVLAEEFDRFLHKYEQLAASVSPLRLYWEWWPKPVFSPGGGNWLTTISRLAGGVNIFEDKKEASCKLEWEDVRKLDPDRICLAWVGVQTEKVRPQLLKKRPGWPDMKAMKENHIHILEEPLYCRPSPRLLLGLQRLAYLLHPSVFPVPDGKDPLLSIYEEELS